ncbi:MAG: hypothetical protein IAG13_21330, partial [Deltaproteobacteria bacterium]|nr:hypothetical protein [Nannocystaceae bacterium]
MLPWLMCAALLVDPQAGRGEISAGVSAELRGGYAPVQAGAPERASMLMLVVPNIDLRYRHRRAGVLTFGYSPRVLYRLPNFLSVERPLFLHQLSLVYGVALNRRWDMFLGTNASLGEIDYTAVTQVFDPLQTEVPDADVLNFAIGDGQLLFTGFLAPRHRLSIAPSVGYRRSLNDNQVVQPDPPPGEPVDPNAAPLPRTSFPNQVSGNLFLSYGYQATRRDEIRLLTFNGVTAFDPGATYLTDDVRLGWVHQIERRVTSEIDAGVLSARRIQPDPDLPAEAQPELQRVLPVGSARIGGRLRARA